MKQKHDIQFIFSDCYDRRFAQNKWKYISQSLLTTVVMFLVLMSMNVVPDNDVLVACIGATAFMVFATPHKNISRERYIIPGYIIAMIVGVVCSLICHSSYMFHAHLMPEYNDEIFGAIAVGLTMLAMVITNSEHPPAVTMALALVINSWTYRTILLTVLAISLLLTYRYLFRKVMIDLV